MIGFIVTLGMAFILVMAWRSMPLFARIIKKYPALGVLLGIAAIVGAVFMTRWASGLAELIPGAGPTGDVAHDVGISVMKLMIVMGLLAALLWQFVGKDENPR